MEQCWRVRVRSTRPLGEACVYVGFEADLVFEVGFCLSISLGLGFQWVEVFL